MNNQIAYSLDEEIFRRKVVSKNEEKLVKRYSLFHLFSSLKRRVMYKGTYITVGDLLKNIGFDINKLTPRIKSLLTKKVSQICYAGSDFQKGSICCQLYDDHDDLMRWAIKNGALLVVTKRQIDDLPCIVVDDPMEIYSEMCEYYCQLRAVPTVVVTGSIGKTTTTQMVNSVYQAQYNTFCTPTNGNHLVRVGTYAQHIPYGTERFVQEVSENPPMHTKYISKILRPKIAILTTTDSSHIEAFGSYENIVRSVCAVTEHMKSPSEYVIVNKDEFNAYNLLGQHKVVTISTKSQDADYYATDVHLTNLGISFTVNDRNRNSKHSILLHNIYAHHNIISALYAFAAGVLGGVNVSNICKGLESYRTNGIRQNIIRTDNNVVVYIDCYNAVTKSMIAALDCTCEIPVKGERIAVLGDIAELGDLSNEIHKQILRHACESKINHLIIKGPNMKMAFDEMAENIKIDVRCCSTNAEVCEILSSIICKDDIILFKSSHSGHLDECVKIMWPDLYNKIIKQERMLINKWKLSLLLN